MKRCATALIILILSAPSLAAEAIAIELNAAQARENGCRLIFTAQSAAGVEELVVETAIFDASGGVALLTLFDFMALPADSMRVRQFDLADTSCDALGMLLLNGVDTCTGPGCAAGLSASSRVETLEVMQ
ncbi:MAG: hypothetical protein AAGH73_07365 [Pseudomonadota bacterium]